MATSKEYLVESLTRIMAANALVVVTDAALQLTVQQNPGDAAAVQFSWDAGVTWYDTPALAAEVVYPSQAADILIEQTAVIAAQTEIIRLTGLAGGDEI